MARPNVIGANIEVVIEAIDKFSSQMRTAATHAEAFASALDKIREKYATIGPVIESMKQQMKGTRDALSEFSTVAAEIRDLRAALGGLGTELKSIASGVRAAAGSFQVATKEVKAAEEQVKKTTDISKQATAEISRLGKIFLAFTAVQRGFRYIGAIAGSVYKLADAYGEVELALRRVEVISGVSEATIARLEKRLVNTANAALGFSATDLAEPLFKFVQAGKSVEEAEAAIGTVTQFAVAAVTDFSNAMEMTLGLMAGFNVRSSELSQAFDTLTEAIATSRLSAEDLAQAISRGGDAANVTNQSLASFLSAIRSMRELGVSAAQAGTTFKVAMLRLASATPQVIKKLEDAGITIRDVFGQLKQWPDLVAEFEAASKRMGLEEFQRLLTEVFGQRGFRAMASSLRIGSTALREWAAEIQAARGTTKEFAEETLETFRYRVEELKASFENLKTILGADFAGPVGGLVEGLSALIQKFSEMTVWGRRTAESLAVLLGAGGVIAIGSYAVKAFAAALTVALGTAVSTTAVLGTAGLAGAIILGTIVLAEMIGRMRKFAIVGESVRQVEAKFRDLKEQIKETSDEIARHNRAFAELGENYLLVKLAIDKTNELLASGKDIDTQSLALAIQNLFAQNITVLSDFREELNKTGGDVGQALENIRDKYISTFSDMREEVRNRLTSALKELEEQQRSLSSAQEEHIKTIRELETRLASAKEKLQRLKEEHKRYFEELERMSKEGSFWEKLLAAITRRDTTFAVGWAAEAENTAGEVDTLSESIQNLKAQLEELIQKEQLTAEEADAIREALRRLNKGSDIEEVLKYLGKVAPTLKLPEIKRPEGWEENAVKLAQDFLIGMMETFGDEKGIYREALERLDRALADALTKGDLSLANKAAQQLLIEFHVGTAGAYGEALRKIDYGKMRKDIEDMFSKETQALLKSIREQVARLQNEARSGYLTGAVDLKPLAEKFAQAEQIVITNFGKDSKEYRRLVVERNDIFTSLFRSLGEMARSGALSVEEFKQTTDELLDAWEVSGDRRAALEAKRAAVIDKVRVKEYENEKARIRATLGDQATMYQQLLELAKKYHDNYAKEGERLSSLDKKVQNDILTNTNRLIAAVAGKVRDMLDLEGEAAVPRAIEYLQRMLEYFEKLGVADSKLAGLKKVLAELTVKRDIEPRLKGIADRLSDIEKASRLTSAGFSQWTKVFTDDARALELAVSGLDLFSQKVGETAQRVRILEEAAKDAQIAPHVKADLESARREYEKLPEDLIRLVSSLPTVVGDELTTLVSKIVTVWNSLDAELKTPEALNALNSAVVDLLDKSLNRLTDRWAEAFDKGETGALDLKLGLQAVRESLNVLGIEAPAVFQAIDRAEEDASNKLISRAYNRLDTLSQTDALWALSFRKVLADRLAQLEAAGKKTTAEWVNIANKLREIDSNVLLGAGIEYLNTRLQLAQGNITALQTKYEELSEFEKKLYGDRKEYYERQQQALQAAIKLQAQLVELYIEQAEKAQTPITRNQFLIQAQQTYQALIQSGTALAKLRSDLGVAGKDLIDPESSDRIAEATARMEDAGKAIREETDGVAETLDWAGQKWLGAASLAVSQGKKFKDALDLETAAKAFAELEESGTLLMDNMKDRFTILEGVVRTLAGEDLGPEFEQYKDAIREIVDAIRDVQARTQKVAELTKGTEQRLGDGLSGILQQLAENTRPLSESAESFKLAASDLKEAAILNKDAASGWTDALQLLERVFGVNVEELKGAASAIREGGIGMKDSAGAIDRSTSALGSVAARISDVPSAVGRAVEEGGARAGTEIDASIRPFVDKLSVAGDRISTLDQFSNLFASSARDVGEGTSEAARSISSFSGLVETLRGLISAMTSAADPLKTALAEFGPAVTAMESAAGDLTSAARGAIESAGTTQSKLDQVAGALSGLNEKLDRLISDQGGTARGLIEVKRVLGDVGTKLGSVAQGSDRAVAQISTLVERVDGITSPINSLVERQDRLGTVLDQSLGTVTTKLDSVASSFGDVPDRVAAALGTRLDDVVGKFGEAASAVREAPTEISNVFDRSLGTLIGRLDDVVGVQNDAAAKISEAAAKFDTVGEQVRSMSSAIGGGLETALADFKTSIREAISKISDTQGELFTSVQGLVGEIGTITGSFQDAASAATRSAESFSAVTGSIDNAVSGIRDSVASLKSLSEIQSAINELRNAIATVGQNIDSAVTTQATISQNVEAASATVSDAISGFKSAQSDLIGRLQDGLGRISDAVARLEQSETTLLSDLRGSVTSFTQDVTGAVSNISSTQDRLVSELNGLVERLNGLGGEIREAISTSSRAAEAFGPIVADIQSVANEIRTTVSTISGIKDPLSSFVSSVQEISASLSTSAGQIATAVQSFPDALNQSLAPAVSSIVDAATASLTTTLEGPVSRIAEAVSEASTVVSKAVSIEEPVATLTTSVQEVAAKFETLVGTVGTQIQSAQTDFTDTLGPYIERSLSPVAEKLSDFSTGVGQLRASLDALETRIASGISSGVSGLSVDIETLRKTIDSIDRIAAGLNDVAGQLPQAISSGVASGITSGVGPVQSALTTITEEQQNVLTSVAALLVSAQKSLGDVATSLQRVSENMPVDVEINVQGLQLAVSEIINEVRNAIRRIVV